MALNVALLRDSFTLVATINPKITTRFYEILFERYPQTQALFPVANRPRQAEMLTGALVAVMDHLEDAPWLTDTLGALGETAGDKWSSELNSAWTEAYGAIVSHRRIGVEHYKVIDRARRRAQSSAR